MNFDSVHRQNRRLDLDLRVLDPHCFGFLEPVDLGAADDTRFLDAGATAAAPSARPSARPSAGELGAGTQ